MRLVVSDAAAELIADRGGRLFVWTRRGRCCGAGMTRLLTSSEAPAGRQFERVEGGDGFDLYLPAALEVLPDELHVEARRFPRRVEAYWNGCAWVV
jgi:hypothetical protein